MVNIRILITGSSGLIGRALGAALDERNVEVVEFDLRGQGSAPGDTRIGRAVRSAVAGCDGIVHLAAVSRVVWGERDPATCWETNVGGTRNVIEAALSSPRAPWLVFASSREVYGQPAVLPASEDTPLRPINVYGQSKVAGENLVVDGRRAGLRGAIVRLSNVYGSAMDHPDRVVPAFARAAVLGARLRVDGASHAFDFTHIDDAIRGFLSVIDLLDSGESPPPIHFLTGQPTTLSDLAALAVELAGRTAQTAATIEEAPPRNFDVSHFYGDWTRARAILGWQPRLSLRDGLSRLVSDFRRKALQASLETRAAPRCIRKRCVIRGAPQ